MMKGKQVLLTGGTGGLGLGVTPAILARGAEVTIPYREEKSIESLKKKLSAADTSRLRFVRADLSQESTIEQLVNDLGKVDILIHLVGGFSMGAVHELDYTDWQKSLALNLNTTFLVCKHCLKTMRRHGYGRIVTVGSRGAVQPAAQLAAYSAAKAGVVALTKAIAEETKDLDITANTVLPSVIDTPANREAMGSEEAAKWVKPESLAQVICFLASEAAKDVSGTAIPVYGQV
jgi:NAD(P)-dependent dehydrogenase (short-subunit alcohol dehydrogenase family)